MSSIKSLLMPLSTSGHIKERMQCALSVTQYFQGHLTVLHAQVNPSQFIPEEHIGLSSKLVKELENVAGKFSESESLKLKEEFSKLCETYDLSLSTTSHFGLNTAQWLNVNGLRSELVAERSKVSDLIIMPQSKTGRSTSTLEAALMRSGKPVLLTPRSATQFQPNTVMIAWNASAESARAINLALPILQNAKQVIITTSTRKAYREPSLEDLAQYLALHGIEAKMDRFNNNRVATGEALLKKAHQENVDLLVMGAYSRRRVREQVFSGVTQYVIAKSDIPVFMTH